MVQKFLATGNNELDTALMYTGGKSESILGSMAVCKDPANNVQIATKVKSKEE